MVSTVASIQSGSLFDSVDSAGVAITSGSLSRPQVIERIMTMNQTASVDFLEAFQDRSLREYLDHLVATQIPRGRAARWVRRGDSPGIVWDEPRD